MTTGKNQRKEYTLGRMDAVLADAKMVAVLQHNSLSVSQFSEYVSLGVSRGLTYFEILADAAVKRSLRTHESCRLYSLALMQASARTKREGHQGDHVPQ